jgi:hypothetical protein
MLPGKSFRMTTPKATSAATLVPDGTWQHSAWLLPPRNSLKRIFCGF